MSRIISFLPASSRAAGWVRPRKKIEDLAAKKISLAPAVKVWSPSVISLPGESMRATGTMQHTSVAEMRTLEPEGLHLHGETIAYQLSDVLIADGCYYVNGHYFVGLPGQRRRPMVISEMVEFDEAQLSSDISSEIYFGHWLCDGLCTELLAADRGLKSIIYQRPVRLHEAGYRALVEVHSVPVEVSRVRRLWVIDDRGINSARGERFLRLRSTLRGKFNSQVNANRVTFITRGAAGESRALLNESELISSLTQYGINVIDPMHMSASEIVAHLSTTTLMISVEGSHNSHALLAMPKGSAILSIQPPQRFLHSWKFFCDLAGIRYGFVIGDECQGGFTLDTARLLKTIDLLYAVT